MTASAVFKDKKAILFDLDGTLIDSVPDLTNAVNHALDHWGKPPFATATVNHWVGNGAQTLVQRAFHAAGLHDEALLEQALPIYHQYYQSHVCVDTFAYDGVSETLAALHQKGIALAIVTNKAERYVRPILKQLELLEYFRCIVGGDTTKHLKPEATPLLHATAQLVVSPAETLMVGDSKNDMLAAQAANINTVAVTYGYNYGERIEQYHPDKSIDHFTQLLSLI